MALWNNRKLLLGAAGIGAALLVRSAVRRQTAWDFRNRVVLITGGSRGLGLILAREFLDHGARVAITGRSTESLQEAERELAGRGQVLTLVCDISDRDQVRAAVDAVYRAWGQIDVLVNNAGVIQAGPLESMTLADFETAMNTHFWGTLYNSLAVLPEMRRRRSGRIVNIASIGGKVSFPHLLPYNASKFAQVGLSEGMRAELLKDGIRVTTVCPGLMRTGSPRNADFKGQHEAEFAWFIVSDSLPGASMNARRAARQILRACRHGDAEVILSLPAKLAVRAQGLMPGLMSNVLALVNRLLPAYSGPSPSENVKGRDLETPWAPSILTRLTDIAAVRNKQILPHEKRPTLAGKVEEPRP